MKIISKLIGAILGATMALGVGIGIWGGHKDFVPVHAASTDYTITAATSGWTTTGEAQSSTPVTGITISTTNGAYNTSNSDFRVYKNNTLTVSSTIGDITSLTFTFSGSNNGGWSTSYTPSSASWTSPTATGTQARIKTLVISIGDSSTPVDPIPEQDSVAYKMFFYNTSKESNYYFTGTMNGYYGATSNTKENGVDVFFETIDSGHYIYFFTDATTKNYLKIVINGTHVNFVYDTTIPEIMWYYNAEHDCMTYTIDDVVYTFGTYGNNTSFGTVNLITYPDNYKVQFELAEENTAKAFASLFLANLLCDSSGSTGPTFTSGYSWEQFKTLYTALDSTEKAKLQGTSENEVINQATERYDYIVAKYGTASYEDFIGRNPAPLASNRLLQNQQVYIPVIVTVAVLGIVASLCAAYFIFKKKKLA